MKHTILIIALALTSCGYSIKSDRELNINQLNAKSMQEELNLIKEDTKILMKTVKDKQRKDSITLVRYKDSVMFMKLSKIMCYQTGTHRHSCMEFKN